MGLTGISCDLEGLTLWYPLINERNYGKSTFLLGKASLFQRPSSITMLNYQRVSSLEESESEGHWMVVPFVDV